MAYWGFAMTILANPLRLPFNPLAMREGWAAVAQAKRLGGPTPRELLADLLLEPVSCRR